MAGFLEMHPQKVKIESLVLDPNNAMTHPEENLKAIKESLSQFGQRKNIVVRNGVIIAGNGTVMAARELGWDEVWIDDASHLSEQAAKAYALADNRTAQLGVWDNDKLGEQLQELYEDGYAIADIGFGANFGEDDFEFNAKEKSVNDETKLNIKVLCESIEQQETLFSELTERGFKVSVL